MTGSLKRQDNVRNHGNHLGGRGGGGGTPQVSSIKQARTEILYRLPVKSYYDPLYGALLFEEYDFIKHKHTRFKSVGREPPKPVTLPSSSRSHKKKKRLGIPHFDCKSGSKGN